MKQEANEQEARELSLYATNNGALRFGRIESVIQNLARKQVKGVYDAAKALKLWRYVADDAAKEYAKEFGGPGYDPRNFSPATRQLAAAEIADYYAESIAERAADMKRDADNRRIWSIAAIRQANERAADGYFFSRKTMALFGDRVSNFAPRFEGGAIYVERVKAGAKMPAGCNVGKRWRFDPETGRIV